jgi:hypothetical protein
MKGMRSMKKGLIIAAAAVFIVGGSALAYKAYARYDGWGHGRHHSRMSADDMGAFADARIAALKAGLRLTPEQEKLWPPVETTLKELAGKRIARREEFGKQRAERREERRAQPDRQANQDRQSPNPIERLRKGADRLSEAGADLKRLADVTDPLYQSLDEAQKRRFSALSHAGMRGMRHHGDGPRWRRSGDMGDEGRHMGPHGRGEGGPGWRRIEWTPEAPRGSERL